MWRALRDPRRTLASSGGKGVRILDAIPSLGDVFEELPLGELAQSSQGAEDR